MTGARLAICSRIRLFGECLRRVLAEELPLECSWHDSAEAELSAADWLSRECALLLLDSSLPCELLRSIVMQMRHFAPDCKLIVLVTEVSVPRMLELTQLGGQGCVRDSSSLEELVSAIRQVLVGSTYYSPELANAIIMQLSKPTDRNAWCQFTDDARLTVREREILRLISAENLSNKQLAKRLHVSIYTVKNHVHNIIEKLDVESRHSAADLARRRNLIWSTAS